MRKITALFQLLILLASFASGQNPAATPTAEVETETPAPAANPSGAKELTSADLDAFLEGVVPRQLAMDDIAGATVSVVKDGKLLFSKGYGYADVANKKPVLPNETLFRPGSVSKLFTWTAVMQLVEQGKLDLDKDVNEYIDFKIPATFGKPITLKNILTHTPGFEEQIKDLIRLDNANPNLGEYLKTHLPNQVYAPGTVPAYSNYATALAGYIVERVSGQPFNDYIDQHIFKPLKMNNSSFAQPLPDALAPKMSGGYRLASDGAKNFEIISPFPAGSLSSTAEDMAQFMLAHLQGGKLGDAQILKPETVKQMHSDLFSFDPAVNAMTHGFYEENSHGLRIIGHGGDTLFFHSDLHLIEEKGVGFFISYNSGGRNQSGGRTALWDAFLDRYFPAPMPSEPTLETAKQDAQKVAGSYLNSRMSETSFFKTISIIGTSKVIANEDGTITISDLNAANGKPKKWREVAPMLFREVDGEDTIFFKADETGRMQVALPYPFMILRKVGVWENGGVLLPVVGVSLGIMLITLILWFVAWLVRRHYGRKLELSRMDWLLRILVRFVFALSLIFVIALVAFMMKALENLDLLSDGATSTIWLIQGIGVAAVVGSLVVFYNAIRSLISRNHGIWMKIQATVFALACLGFLWFVFAGNLISFKSTF